MATSARDELAPYAIKMLEDLRLGESEGAGSFGAVYQVRVNGCPCIAKRLHDILVGYRVSDKDKTAVRDRFTEECLLLSRLRHPNVVQFIGVHYGPSPGDLCLIMEGLYTDLDRCLEKHRSPPLLPDMAIQAADALAPYEIKSLQEIRSGESEGAGCFGAVYRVKVNGFPCIAKRLHDILLGRNREVRVSEKEKAAIRGRFREESILLSRLRHPNIVQFIGVHYGRNREDLTLVMEGLYSDLDKCLTKCVKEKRTVPIPLQLSILLDVAYGLHYLHSQKPPIIHRDLKASNILLTRDMRAKLADLGVSKILNLHPMSESIQSTCPGTLGVMPPEALVENPKYDEKLDDFSFGTLVLHVSNGEFPMSFEVQDAKKGHIHIAKRKAAIDKMGAKHVLYELVIRCLQDKPERRPTTAEICATLERLCKEHPKKHFTDMLVMHEQIEMLEKELYSLPQELDLAKSTIEDLRYELQQLQEQNAVHKAWAKTFEEDFLQERRDREQAHSMKAEMEQLYTHQLACMATKLQELHTETVNFKEALADIESSLSDQIRLLQEQEDYHGEGDAPEDVKISMIQSAIESLKDSKTEMESALAASVRENERLKARCSESDLQLWSLQESQKEERKQEQATADKEKGNTLFKEGHYQQAVECYTRAMQLDPLSAVHPANRAMVLLKQEKYVAAEEDCSIALALDSSYVKAYFRRGSARVKLGKLAEAKEDFEEVVRLDPGNRPARTEIRNIGEKMGGSEQTKEAKQRGLTSSWRTILRLGRSDSEKDDGAQQPSTSSDSLPELKALVAKQAKDLEQLHRENKELKSQLMTQQIQAQTFKEDFEQERRDREAAHNKYSEMKQKLSAQLTAARTKLRETQLQLEENRRAQADKGIVSKTHHQDMEERQEEATHEASGLAVDPTAETGTSSSATHLLPGSEVRKDSTSKKEIFEKQCAELEMINEELKLENTVLRQETSELKKALGKEVAVLQLSKENRHSVDELQDEIESPLMSDQMTAGKDGDSLISEYEHFFISHSCELLGVFEGEGIHSYTAGRLLSFMFMCAYEQLTEQILQEMVAALRRLFHVQDTPQLRVEDTVLPYTLLHSACCLHKKKEEISAVTRQKAWEKITTPDPSIQADMPQINQAVERCTPVMQDTLKKATDLAWSLLTTVPPMVATEPTKYCSDVHNYDFDYWDENSSEDLKYFKPVLYRNCTGQPAAKGTVTNTSKHSSQQAFSKSLST